MRSAVSYRMLSFVFAGLSAVTIATSCQGDPDQADQPPVAALLLSSPEDPSEVCSDRVDNDGNSLVDCADPACKTDPSCQKIHNTGGDKGSFVHCGDNQCNDTENCSTCPGDCGACTVTPTTQSCGDEVCDETEDCSTCPVDCGTCPTTLATQSCGDEVCNETEDCSTCPADCGACPTTLATQSCGDEVCNETEDCSTCPADCGTCPGAGQDLAKCLKTCQEETGDAHNACIEECHVLYSPSQAP